MVRQALDLFRCHTVSELPLESHLARQQLAVRFEHGNGARVVSGEQPAADVKRSRAQNFSRRPPPTWGAAADIDVKNSTSSFSR